MKAPYFQIYVFLNFFLTNPTNLSFLSCAQSLRFVANLCSLRTLLFKKIRAVSRSFCANQMHFIVLPENQSERCLAQASPIILQYAFHRLLKENSSGSSCGLFQLLLISIHLFISIHSRDKITSLLREGII